MGEQSLLCQSGEKALLQRFLPRIQTMSGWEGRATPDATVSSTLDGQFRTAPEARSIAPVRFTVVTGQNYHDRDLPAEGWKIYRHMQGLNPDFKDKKEPEHTYVNVVGGFLEGAVDRRDGRPALTFRHYSVDGKVLNEDVVGAK